MQLENFMIKRDLPSRRHALVPLVRMNGGWKLILTSNYISYTSIGTQFDVSLFFKINREVNFNTGMFVLGIEMK